MRSLRWTEAVESDHDTARRWYAEAEPGLDREFTAAVDAALVSILSRPDAFRVVSARHRRFVMRRFPYSLLYRFDEHQVIVEALFHHKLHPDLLRKRLRDH
jgi:plasmid stabilization system protein ParE